MLAGGGKKRAVITRIQQRQRGKNGVAHANGVPVHRRTNPERLLLPAFNHRAERLQHAAADVVADELPRGRRKFVAEHEVRLGQLGGEAGRAEFGHSFLAVKIFQVAVVRRIDPGFFGAQRGDGFFQRRQKPAAIFQRLGPGEKRNAVAPAAGNCLPVRAIARLGVFEKQTVWLRRQGLAQGFFSR